MLSVKQKQKAVVERQRGPRGYVSSVGVTDGLRGSTAGLLEGRRGRVLGMHPTVTPSVHIVNPTLTTAIAPGLEMSGTSTVPGLKRLGQSPHANATGVSRLGPGSPSMTVPSGVPDNSQRSSPLISSVYASNSAATLRILWLLQILRAPLPLLLLAQLCRARVVWGTLPELQWVLELLLTLVDVQ